MSRRRAFASAAVREATGDVRYQSARYPNFSELASFRYARCIACRALWTYGTNRAEMICTACFALRRCSMFYR